MSDSTTKYCPGCTQTLPVTAFAKDRTHKDGYGGHCKECRRTYNRAYYARTADDQCAKKRDEYHLTADRQRAYARQWAKNNPERKAERDRLRQQRLGETWKKYIREWRDRNRQRLSWYTTARRARKHNAPGSHTIAEWEALKAHHSYRCLACGKQEPEIKLTEDHVIPLGPNGSDSIENVQPLCGPCNSKKHQRTIDYR